MQLKPLFVAACIVLLAGSSSAHVPERCDVIQEEALPLVHQKFGIAAELERAVQRRDVRQTFELAGRLLRIDGILFRKFTAWMNCIEE